MIKKLALLVSFLVIFSASSSFAAKFANDPTRLSIGARVLGMGGCFVGVADDPSAIFINPGGLGTIKNWQLSSMSGKFINIFDYVELSALYPTSYGTFGLGYGGSSIDFHFPSAEVIIIGDETRIVATGEVSGRYANIGMLLSYGRQQDIWQFKNVSLGGSLKLLSQDLNAGTAGAGTASGMELNLGLLYPYKDDLTFGLAVENALPANMGGKVTWSTDTEEPLPARLKAGVNYMMRRQLRLGLDYDQYVTRAGLPGLWHLGVEWLPNEFVALRTGIDQSHASDIGGNVAVSNDVSYGLGLLFRGFRFDYAYHTYNSLPENATNYFSLGYVAEPKPVKKLEVVLMEVCEVELKSFKDVPPGYWAKLPIEQLATLGIISGYPDGTFRPDGSITRAELVTLLMRTKSPVTGSGPPVGFNDVAASHWAAKYIAAAARDNVVGGYPDGTFRPGNAVTRAEVMAIIVRFAKLPGSTVAEVPFADVPGRYWAIKDISLAKEAGYLDYIRGANFSPKSQATRAEVAYILAKTAEIKRRIDALMNCETLL
ncbi:S-layer homology domain-containing protein [Candidatus Margulisiibacteriota bacterium]